jgi:cyanophycinase
MSLFLHGGGGKVEWFQPFVRQCERIALILVSDSEENELGEYQEILQEAGASSDAMRGFLLGRDHPLEFEEFTAFSPDGVLICGGSTPLYQELLCQDSSLKAALQSQVTHICGTSAGAAILSANAIVGGWKLQGDKRATQILFQGAGEGLEYLTIREGFGLVDFGVDLHASQWGTLTRLINAVHAGHLDEGVAIDEDTVLIPETMTVYGDGQVYHVLKQAGGGVRVNVLSPM